jgi:multidrug efflux pump subunit AcrB/ABC-type multidrug transport system ATPase subunit
VNLITLPIRRPVAVSMFFLGIALVGAVAWQRMPVELFPALEGDRLFITFARPGSEPQVVERELLLPLQARVSALPLVSETWGQVQGSAGRFEVSFERGSDLKVRALELQRIAAGLQRSQPLGTIVNVNTSDTSLLASFVMIVNVLGRAGDDVDAIHDLAEQLVVPRLASVSGVSQALATGGAPRQVTVTVDPDRAAALGITTTGVLQSVQRNVDRLRYLGQLESETGRMPVVLDGRPRGLISLAEARISPESPVRLRHVGTVGYGVGREENLFRVNGQPAVGVILFQEEGANLVRLGRQLRDRIEAVREELGPIGVDLVTGFDAADLVEEQIARLASLGASGFAIALVVLYLFLRQWRAVAVVGIAVPVSLLAALSALYLVGESLNLITLFGLALAVGLLVDNSVVVYEAVQRRLERGADAEVAVIDGLRRTVRAIVGATATTAVVFLPALLIEFDDSIIRELIGVMALSILLPLGASLLVAVGLVPLLAHRLAAPAALRTLARARRRRAEHAGLLAPDRARMLFAGVVAGAMRHPPAWIAGTAVAVIVTAAIALPAITVRSAVQEAPEADSVQMDVRLSSGQGSLEAVSDGMARLENAVMSLDGVERVEATVQEDGGSLTIQLVDASDRPPGFSAQSVRALLRRTASAVQGLQVLRPGEGETGGGQGGGGGGGGEGGLASLLGGSPLEVVLSGPDSQLLQTLAGNIRARLESMPQVDAQRVSVSARPGLDEIWVEPNHRAFESFGLTLDQVLPVLQLAGREGERMQTGFLQPGGRELPLVVERLAARRQRGASRDLANLRVQTDAGVVPVAALAQMRRMPAPPVIQHHNGRRELTVFYELARDVPESGQGRLVVEEQIAAAVQAVPRPDGFTVETPAEEASTSWFRRVLLPVVGLLFLVLAMTFESLTLPALVLFALPLTVLGATWALAFAGMGLDVMAMLGALALFGLTVNPAILLVDRMQQLVQGDGWSAGAAALASVRERTRPVLMTSATTVAALWPLALVTGRENEIWPPFATIVIGGLATSTLLTLLIIPVGFILLRNLDELFGRVGPWLVLAWLGSTVGTMTALILSGAVTSLFWQVALSLLVGGALLAIVVLVFRRRDPPEPTRTEEKPPVLVVRSLRKVYGLPGPIRAALRAHTEFARRVVDQGGRAFDVSEARGRLVPLAIGTGAVAYLGLQFGDVWRLVAWMVAAAFGARLLTQVRRARGKVDAYGVVRPGGVEGWAAVLVPWFTLVLYAWLKPVDPQLLSLAGGEMAVRARGVDYSLPVVAGLMLALVQAIRRSARRQASGHLARRAMRGPLRPLRSLWRRFAFRAGGLDLPASPVTALAGVTFRVERGMVGVLGPNGAGKTTLLRQLAGVLDPTRGTIGVGGVSMRLLQRYLARWVGYLPQDAGLPGTMTPREYLSYFAALYDLPPEVRRERVEGLLEEVGLTGKTDEPIKALSGGMRQRVAVARTLLRLPPIIIVDEPTVGLDPSERIRFRNLLSRLARERIVLFSTHVVEDVAVACERVLVLARGRLLFDGEPSALADAARGRVWEVRTAADADLTVPPGAIRAEATPAADGSAVHRILSATAPADAARPLDATLEDGYLWLLAGPAAARA